MDTTALMAASTGIQETETATGASTAIIMAATTTQEKDRAVYPLCAKHIDKKAHRISIPKGRFCGHSCIEGCVYWNPNDTDKEGRQYCIYWRTYVQFTDIRGCRQFTSTKQHYDC